MFYCQNCKNSIINKINTQNIILVRLREAYATGKIFLCLIEKKMYVSVTILPSDSLLIDSCLQASQILKFFIDGLGGKNMRK